MNYLPRPGAIACQSVELAALGNDDGVTNLRRSTTLALRNTNRQRVDRSNLSSFLSISRNACLPFTTARSYDLRSWLRPLAQPVSEGAGMGKSSSAEIRARLSHPIIDSDGHTVEFLPAFLDVLKEVAGPDIADRYVKGGGLGSSRWYQASPRGTPRASDDAPSMVGCCDEKHHRPCHRVDAETAL